MNIEQFALAGSIVIGLVNGAELAFNKQWLSFAKFMIAVVLGAAFGFLGWFGLPSLEIGLAIGLSSSGVYKLVSKIN